MRWVLAALRAGEQSGDEPADRRSDGSPTNSHRGQSQVLGLVLLVGIVVAGSSLVLFFGASGLEASESAVEIEHAEHSLLAFTHDTRTTVATGHSPSDVSLGPFNHGHVVMRDEAGRVTVTLANDSGSTEALYNESLGTLAYVNGDTEIAYQGGGVWRTDGVGSTTVSEPGIEYRNGTIRFPIVHLDGSRVRGNAIDGTVRRAATPEQVDLDGRSSRTRASVAARIAIESEYCNAWERELEDSLEGSVIEGCEEGEPQRVRIQLLVPSEDSRAFDSAVIGETIEADFNGSPTGHPIDGDARARTVDEWLVNGTVSNESYDYPPADAEIDRALDACDEFTALDETVTEPGVHCVDEIDSDHHFDTSTGDIDVVVRDSFELPSGNGNLSVTGGNDLTIYADTDFEMQGNAAIGNESDALQTRLVFSSEATVQTVSGTPAINALLYAPESTVNLNGTPTVVGTVVGDRVVISDAAIEIRGDGSLEALEFIPGAGPQVPYPDFTVYEAEIDD